VIGLFLVLTQASAAWRAGRDRVWAGIALGIGILEVLFILGVMFLSPFA
jgi:hypothetical protein